MNNYKVYCDMDGVIVDFDKGYLELTGHQLDGTHRSDTHFWDPINKAGYDFWINLEWIKPDGESLWEYIKKYNPIILSAPSNRPESRVAKRNWVGRELPGTEILLRSAKHKKDFASPNSILIDDRLDNIQSWVDAGGIGVHHKNFKDTLKQLNDLGL